MRLDRSFVQGLEGEDWGWEVDVEADGWDGVWEEDCCDHFCFHWHEDDEGVED